MKAAVASGGVRAGPPIGSRRGPQLVTRKGPVTVVVQGRQRFRRRIDLPGRDLAVVVRIEGAEGGQPAQCTVVVLRLVALRALFLHRGHTRRGSRDRHRQHDGRAVRRPT